MWFSSQQLRCPWNSGLIWATIEFWFWWEEKFGIYWTKLLFLTLMWHNWKWRHDSWKKPKMLEYSGKVLSMLTSLLVYSTAGIGRPAKSCHLCLIFFFFFLLIFFLLLFYFFLSSSFFSFSFFFPFSFFLSSSSFYFFLFLFLLFYFLFSVVFFFSPIHWKGIFWRVLLYVYKEVWKFTVLYRVTPSLKRSVKWLVWLCVFSGILLV